MLNDESPLLNDLVHRTQPQLGRFRPARWYYEPSRASLIRTKEGHYPEGAMSVTDTEIPFQEIPSLIQALEENGLLKPRLDDRLRADDLKVTHRLLDILDTLAKRP